MWSQLQEETVKKQDNEKNKIKKFRFWLILGKINLSPVNQFSRTTRQFLSFNLYPITPSNLRLIFCFKNTRNCSGRILSNRNFKNNTFYLFFENFMYVYKEFWPNPLLHSNFFHLLPSYLHNLLTPVSTVLICMGMTLHWNIDNLNHSHTSREKWPYVSQ